MTKAAAARGKAKAPFIALQAGGAHKAAMPPGLSAALIIAAQAAAAGPAAPPPKEPPARAPERECVTPTRPDPNSDEIVVCAPKVEGYRLDPDVLDATRARRAMRSGRPTRPGPAAMKDSSRCVVGPEGCASAGINVLGVALTAAQMASRLAKGESIGGMFVTDPQPSEYQLYLEAKRAREAREAEERAEAAARKREEQRGTIDEAGPR